MGILFKNPNDINEFASKLGAAYYSDPETGYKVFTSFFLLERNSCCHSGCRHCPYTEQGLTEATEEVIVKS